MNEQELKDLNELKEQVMYTGFQENLDNELQQLIAEDLPKSQITKEKVMDNQDHLAVDFNFGKSEKTGKHYLNNFHIKMTKPNGEVTEQTFYRNFGNNITFKEAYNLLNGRAVYKTGLVNKEEERYNAWLQLDFTKADKHGNYKYQKYHDGYGFDVEAKLKERGYKQMAFTGEDNYFVSSVKKGDCVLGTRTVDGNEIKEYVEANPRFKTINVYDLNHKRQLLNKKESEEMGTDQKVSQNQSESQGEKQAESQQQSNGTAKRSTKSAANSIKENAKTEKQTAGQRRGKKSSISA